MSDSFTGRVAIPLANQGFQITEINRSPSMLEAGYRRSPLVEWLEADVQNFDPTGLERLLDWDESNRKSAAPDGDQCQEQSQFGPGLLPECNR